MAKLSKKGLIVAESVSAFFVDAAGKSGVAVTTEGSAVAMAPTGYSNGSWGVVLPGGSVYEGP
jgi:hypothetical protein